MANALPIGNRRHSRFGNLRYAPSLRLALEGGCIWYVPLTGAVGEGDVVLNALGGGLKC